MKKNLVEIDIVSVLKFYDEAVGESDHHATAINAVAGEDLGAGLLIHYFHHNNIHAKDLGKCTQGTKRGVRLDKWIRAENNGNYIYYQTEIKNWSAHAIGGKKLTVEASDDDLALHKTERWQHHWDEKNIPRAKTARKVLVRMKPKESNWKIEPLICFWDAMHPKGKRDSFFSVKIRKPKSEFSRVWVFSISSYLRDLRSSGIDVISIEMPDTISRMRWLNRLFKIPK